MLVGVTLWGVCPAKAETSIQGPITALRLNGDHLLIGQGPTLVDAQITPDALHVIRSKDLGRHDIRAIAFSQDITLALSEDGLTSLDTNGQILDFIQGGGQRLAVKGQRIYIAALDAGLRVLSIDPAGKLSRLGTVKTRGPAQELAPEGDTWVWVAEGASGVRLYDTRDPFTPSLVVWLGDVNPATMVRVSGTHLYVGYANHLAILDTLNIQAPKLIGSVDVEGADARINALLFQGPRAFVGRLAASGADVVAINIQDLQAPAMIAHSGENGAGESLAVYDDDLFVGSGRIGLQRLRFAGNVPTVLATWGVGGTAEGCTLSAPSDPQPANLSEVEAGPVSLIWKAACSPSAYEIKIDGTPVATVKTPPYGFTPAHDATMWQVTALDATGERVEGPVWTFDSLARSWLATPFPVPLANRLYVPPPVSFNTPGIALAVTCGALFAGLLIVIGAAWAIGTLAERRATNRERS